MLKASDKIDLKPSLHACSRKPITPWTCARCERAQMMQQIMRRKDA